MNELFEKFPELIKSLLEKISQSDYGSSNPEMKSARDKLMSQLHEVMNQISYMQHQDPGVLTEDQMKRLIDMPRSLPASMQWKIKPRKKPGGSKQD